MKESKNSNVKATFSFKPEGAKYEVLECSYGFTQNYHMNNTPSGRPIINVINLVVKVSEKTELVDWMVSKKAEKNGLIEIKLTTSTSRKIEFTRGTCINYSERYDHYNGFSYHLNLSILAKEIKINGREYMADWDKVK